MKHALSRRRARARGRSARGQPEERWRRCAAAAFGTSRRHPARLVRWPLRARRSVRGGGPSRSASGAPAVRHQRWIPRSVHRGSTEQASNTARGTPKVRRTCGSKTYSASLGVARRRGPWVRQDPGVPRALFLSGVGERSARTGDPGAQISNPRAAQRWLYCVMLEFDSGGAASTLPLVGRVASEASGVGWKLRQKTPPPTPPHKGEGSRPPPGRVLRPKVIVLWRHALASGCAGVWTGRDREPSWSCELQRAPALSRHSGLARMRAPKCQRRKRVTHAVRRQPVSLTSSSGRSSPARRALPR